MSTDTQMTTLFLSNVTVIDHAYIDAKGNIVGNSIRPYFEIYGVNDPVEQVIVDFSTLKKSMKRIIDDNEHGMDHKLWVFDDSDVEVKYTTGDQGENRIVLNNNKFFFDLPLNAVHFVNRSVTSYKDSVESYLCEFLIDNLDRKEADQINTLTCTITDNFLVPPHLAPLGIVIPFRYTHGLKNSTSWGCQSPVHGHYSFLALEGSLSTANTEKIRNLIDGAVFVHSDNVKHLDIHKVSVEYTTPRGKFYVSYMRSEVKFFMFDSETTVENLAFGIKQLIIKELGTDVSTLARMYVSEGLDKGSFISFN